MDGSSTRQWNVEFDARRERILSYLLLGTVIAAPIPIALLYFGRAEGVAVQDFLLGVAPFVVCWLVALGMWLWRDLDYLSKAWVFVGLFYLVAGGVFARGGLAASWWLWLFLPVALAFFLISPFAGLLAAALGVVAYGGFAVALNQGWISPQIPAELTPLQMLIREGASFLGGLTVLVVVLWIFTRGWLEDLRRANSINTRLEERMWRSEKENERLHRQVSHLRTTVEVARAGASILSQRALLDRIVTEVEEGFHGLGVYFVGLFFPDDEGRALRLRAAKGEVGDLLLKTEHALEVDGSTTVGWAVLNREIGIVSDPEGDTARFGSPLLEQSKSEVALPLQSRGELVGVLNLQSSKEAAFNEIDIAILRTMADLIAVSIENTRIFHQTEETLAQVQTAHRRYLAQAWREFLSSRPTSKVEYGRLDGEGNGERSFLNRARRAAMAHRRTVVMDGSSAEEQPDGQSALVVPLRLRGGHVVGTITLCETDQRRGWSEEEVALAETIAEQVALTVENLRLMDEAQRRAAREQGIREVSDQIQLASDIESLLRIAADELNRALGGSRVYVHLGRDEARDAADGNGHGS